MKTNTAHRPRCENCGLYENICICDFITQTTLDTRLTLLIHSKEIRKVTNTGRLAHLCLDNSALFIRGRKDIRWTEEEILPAGYEHRILFPTAREELKADTKVIDGKPLNLIVPDGTWGQAKKMVTAVPFLQNIKRIKLPRVPSNHHYVRKSLTEGGISTLEAIARAFGILENSEIQEQLEKVLFEMTEKFNRIRGYRLGEYTG